MTHYFISRRTRFLRTLDNSPTPLTTPSAQACANANSATILNTGLCLPSLSLSSLSFSLSTSLEADGGADEGARIDRRAGKSKGRKSGDSRV